MPTPDIKDYNINFQIKGYALTEPSLVITDQPPRVIHSPSTLRQQQLVLV